VRVVALFTGARDVSEHVIRLLGLQVVGDMARLARGVGPLEIADLCIGMAREAGHGQMGADERESRARVGGRLPLSAPVGHAVAILTFRPELPAVLVDVAAGAAALRELLHWSSVVVAAKALRLAVGAFERVARLLRVVEREIGTELAPAPREVAESAVGWKCVMGDDGAVAARPAVGGRGRGSVERACREKQPYAQKCKHGCQARSGVGRRKRDAHKRTDRRKPMR